MFSFGFLGGVIVELIVICLLVCLDEDIRDRDRFIGADNVDSDRERDGLDRPSREDIENVLYTFRVGATGKEKKVIDYLINREGEQNEDD